MKLIPKFKWGGRILKMQPGGQVPSNLITIDGVPATYIDGKWYRGNMLPEVTVELPDYLVNIPMSEYYDKIRIYNKGALGEYYVGPYGLNVYEHADPTLGGEYDREIDGEYDPHKDVMLVRFGDLTRKQLLHVMNGNYKIFRVIPQQGTELLSKDRYNELPLNDKYYHSPVYERRGDRGYELVY